jgi:hypothetical protein
VHVHTSGDGGIDPGHKLQKFLPVAAMTCADRLAGGHIIAANSEIEHDFAQAWRPKPKWVVQAILVNVWYASLGVWHRLERSSRRVRLPLESSMTSFGKIWIL